LSSRTRKKGTKKYSNLHKNSARILGYFATTILQQALQSPASKSTFVLWSPKEKEKKKKEKNNRGNLWRYKKVVGKRLFFIAPFARGLSLPNGAFSLGLVQGQNAFR
jgi:hypothetical protein